MAVVSGGRSTLNPDAPLFIPSVFRQVEDFSPEWWKLVKTSTWFHDYWLNQNQDEEALYGFGEDNNGFDDTDLLPESFDLDTGEELFLNLDAQLEEFFQSFEAKEENESSVISDVKKEKPRNGLEMDAEALMKNLSLSKSSKEKGAKSWMESAKYREKPVKCVSPKCNPGRIHQPR